MKSLSALEKPLVSWWLYEGGILQWWTRENFVIPANGDQFDAHISMYIGQFLISLSEVLVYNLKKGRVNKNLALDKVVELLQ